jgi:hypothetical protein
VNAIYFILFVSRLSCPLFASDIVIMYYGIVMNGVKNDTEELRTLTLGLSESPTPLRIKYWLLFITGQGHKERD